LRALLRMRRAADFVFGIVFSYLRGAYPSEWLVDVNGGFGGDWHQGAPLAFIGILGRTK